MEKPVEQPIQIDENQYQEERLNQLTQLGIDPYPYGFDTNSSFYDIILNYNDIDDGSHLEEDVYSLTGRVKEKRSFGKKLHFYSMVSNGDRLQFVCNKSFYKKEDFNNINKAIHRGDIIGIKGFVGKTKKGELSIFVTDMELLTPCLKYLPSDHYGITDSETRARKRYFDLIVNDNSRDQIIIRSLVYKNIREYLDNRGFIEVETPVLASKAGGASAQPFITHHNDLDQNMFMRVAPELYLKKLVVGGLDRVYEIGKQFRNEGIDRTHSPEFSSLEFYMAFVDYFQLMEMCEDLISTTVLKIHNTQKLKYVSLDLKEYEIDFTPPYQRLDIITELTKEGIDFPNDLYSEDARVYFDDKCNELGVECSEPRTTTRLLDKLIGHFIEPKCINPTFIINHPTVMSPLAKPGRNNPEISERFELFICGTELANAYSELNDPNIQKQRFLEQQKDKDKGDQEAQVLDEDFVEALEYGLPPTGGLGIGLDRFVMYLANKNVMRDVIAFPAMNNK